MSLDGVQQPAGEASADDAGRLLDLQERFILHWGEMANAWGINRTMGQIHALLYVSPEPLSMDEVMERLKISRGNASMNLRNLEDWGIVQRVHFRGDRREYFRTLTDVWELFSTLVRERKRREFDPTIRSLRQFLTDAEAAPDGDAGLAIYRERLGNLLGLLDLIQMASEQLLPRDPGDLPRLFGTKLEEPETRRSSQ